MRFSRASSFVLASVIVLAAGCNQVTLPLQPKTSEASRVRPDRLPHCYPHCFKLAWRMVNYTDATLSWHRRGSNCMSLPTPSGSSNPGWHPAEFHFAAKTGGVCNNQTRWYVLRFTRPNGDYRDFAFDFYERTPQGGYIGMWGVHQRGHKGNLIFCFYNANPGYYLARPWTSCHPS